MCVCVCVRACMCVCMCVLVFAHRERAERRAIRSDLRRLAGEERQRQEAAVREVIKGAQVIASTLTGVLHHHLEVCVCVCV